MCSTNNNKNCYTRRKNYLLAIKRKKKLELQNCPKTTIPFSNKDKPIYVNFKNLKPDKNAHLQLENHVKTSI